MAQLLPNSLDPWSTHDTALLNHFSMAFLMSFR
jgi:hypothetical protein